MIAIATIREKLATIAARLTIACPGAPRSCASARGRGDPGHGSAGQQGAQGLIQFPHAGDIPVRIDPAQQRREFGRQ
ncbi:hypothetical protein D3C83_29800 [compost metagenome]